MELRKEITSLAEQMKLNMECVVSVMKSQQRLEMANVAATAVTTATHGASRHTEYESGIDENIPVDLRKGGCPNIPQGTKRFIGASSGKSTGMSHRPSPSTEQRTCDRLPGTQPVSFGSLQYKGGGRKTHDIYPTTPVPNVCRQKNAGVTKRAAPRNQKDAKARPASVAHGEQGNPAKKKACKGGPDRRGAPGRR